MKITSSLLSLSLAANAVLAWLVFAPPAPPPPASPAISHSSDRRPASDSANAPSLTKKIPAESPAALRDRLVALGLPADAVQAALRAQLEAPRLARLRELRATTPALPWWQGIAGYRFTPDQERELRELRRTEREELTRLFGSAGTVTATEIEPYLFLPPNQAARLAALERDYTELRAQLSETGPTDPAAVDSRKRLLEADRARDLAALLDPAERTALDLRQSPTARDLAERFAYFDGTEAEYRALYDLQKAFHEKFPPIARGAVVFFGGEDRSLAQKKLTSDQQAALDPERFAAWERTQRADFRTVVDLQRRFALAPATVDAMNQLPFDTAAASTRIGGDPNLTAAQKSDAIKTLATQARAQVRATLGPSVAEAYLSSSANQWLNFLERGSTFTFGNSGLESVKSFTGNPPPPK